MHSLPVRSPINTFMPQGACLWQVLLLIGGVCWLIIKLLAKAHHGNQFLLLNVPFPIDMLGFG